MDSGLGVNSGMIYVYREETMTKRKRRNHSSNYKAKVALEALREEVIKSEVAEKYDLHAKPIRDWKSDLVWGAE